MDMLRSALRVLSQSISRLSHKQKRGLPSARVMHFSWREGEGGGGGGGGGEEEGDKKGEEERREKQGEEAKEGR